MAFLTPLFLLGAAGIALPVVFHLIRRTTREVTPFSSLMFLRPSPPRITQRSRLENLLLLLLRASALALIALSFARPFLPRVTALAGQGGILKRTVILLDTSASMRRENLWAEGLQRAEQALHGRESQDEVALVAFDREARTVFNLDAWRQVPTGARTAQFLPSLKSLTPTWAGTALGPALLRASDLLSAPAPQETVQRQIIVISDLQEGSHLDGLQGFPWPKGTSIALERLTPKQPANAGLQWLADTAEGVAPAAAANLRIRVTSSPGSPHDQFELRWADLPAQPPIAAYAPAGQSRTISVPAVEGAHPLSLTGDDTPFDNTLFVARTKLPARHLLFIGRDAEESTSEALFFLLRAFPKRPGQNVEILSRPGDQVLEPQDLAAADLLVFGNGVTDAAVEGARKFAEGGRTVLIPLPTAASAGPLARLLNQPALTAAEASPKDYALLSQIDFRHPLFAPFADPRFSDFTKIHFWHYRRLDFSSVPEAAVLARFEAGDPALVEVPLGKGSVVVFTSTWRPGDSQLALSSKFLPLLQALLDRSGGHAEARAQYSVGEEIPISTNSGESRVQTPAGESVPVVGGRFTATGAPGFYTLAPNPTILTVNLDPAESRTAPLTDAQLTALGLPLALPTPHPSAADARQREAAVEESQQKLWRWLLLAALLVLLAETALAARRESVHTPQPA